MHGKLKEISQMTRQISDPVFTLTDSLNSNEISQKMIGEKKKSFEVNALFLNENRCWYLSGGPLTVQMPNLFPLGKLGRPNRCGVRDHKLSDEFHEQLKYANEVSSLMYHTLIWFCCVALDLWVGIFIY